MYFVDTIINADVLIGRTVIDKDCVDKNGVRNPYRDVVHGINVEDMLGRDGSGGMLG